MHTATRHAAERTSVGSPPIGDRPRTRRTAIAAAIIAIMGLADNLPFVSPASAQGNAASLARVADPFTAFVAEASQRFGISALWIRAVMRAESGGNVRAVSPKGAMGLMQIMPATWAELRVRHGLGADPYDPRENILAGAAYLRELHDRYGSPGFLAAYNAGPGRYENHMATGRPLPDETRAYVAAITPLIGERQIDDAGAVMSVAGSWVVAPIFLRQDDSIPAVEQALSPARSNRPSNTSRVVDMSALVPRSDNLFVPISERGLTR